MPTGVIVDGSLAFIIVVILVAVPILWWIILTLTGRIGRRRR